MHVMNCKASWTSQTFVVVLGGCTWSPWGSDKDRKNDSGVSEKEGCTLKVSACRNTCYEADLGSGCLACCKRNGDACDRDDDYSFYECPDNK